MIVSIFFTILLTIICSLGNGIHDIGITGFPVVIGFSSVLLGQKQMLAASVMSLLGLAWLVIGEHLNLFEPIPIKPGDVGDFIITGAMIVFGGSVAFSLTTNMKNSLKIVTNEIKISKSEGQKLVEEIGQKEEIIVEIHKTVINSLDQLEIIINDHERTDPTSKSTYESLERKILVIKAAHSLLLEDQSPLILDLNQFTIRVLEGFKSNLDTKEISISVDRINYPMGVDQAIYFGICMTELLFRIDQSKQDSISLSISTRDNVFLEIAANDPIWIEEDEMVLNLLTQQLKGRLSIDGTKASLTFG